MHCDKCTDHPAEMKLFGTLNHFQAVCYGMHRLIVRLKPRTLGPVEPEAVRDSSKRLG